MNRNRKQIGKATVTVLCVAVLTNSLMAGVWAADGPEKDENVYVNLNMDGSVSGIYIVNEYDLDENTEITDYGNYSSVQNLSSDDAISLDGEKVCVSAPAGKFYYQGNMTDTTIPWDIHITYKLDGTETAPEDLAGKSGKLEIGLSVKENKESEDEFFDNYLVQGTVTLDTKKCGKIQAGGATQANVGSDRQLLYNIMAGQEKEFTITADVTDFEMDAISFQAVPMSFAINRDDMDLDELYDKTDEIKDAADEFDDGADELRNGVGELLDGSSDLKDGAGKLSDGADDLKTGTAKIKKGADNLKTGANKLASGNASLSEGLTVLSSSLSQMQEMLSASTQINTGIGGISDGVNGLSDALNGLQQQYDGLGELNTQNSNSANYLRSVAAQARTLYKGLDAAQKKMVDAVGDVNAIADNLDNVASLLEMNNSTYDALGEANSEVTSGAAELAKQGSTLKEKYQEFDTQLNSAYGQVVTAVGQLEAGAKTAADGSSQLASGSSSLAVGTGSLKSGADTLVNGTKDLKDGTTQLYDGVTELSDGTDDLKDGTTEFKDKTSDIDQQIDDAIDDAIKDFSGEDYTPVSFASEENTQIGLVQFAMTTNAIEIKEAETEEETEHTDSSFLGKVKQLFTEK